MPFFNETQDASHAQYRCRSGMVYGLEDCFARNIPVTSIEFNPPPVSAVEKQHAAYWLTLQTPDADDQKVLKALAIKLKSLQGGHAEDGIFASITDSAAGILRLHNTAMIRLLADGDFTKRLLSCEPMVWEPRRVIVHLTRNHSIPWLNRFVSRCRQLGFRQLLLITGDPLKEIKLKTTTAEEALVMDEEMGSEHRLKNSVELVKFMKIRFPEALLGVGHNPFMKRSAAEKHLTNKLEAGARFIITQPVSYYKECWDVMAEFREFMSKQPEKAHVILGVFNYSVPCTQHGYKEDVFEKRYRFWRKLFGFVPDGVKEDYDRGLSGNEILGRSINKLKRMGYFHFDVMNAEKNGRKVIRSGRRLAHELDRLAGES